MGKNVAVFVDVANIFYAAKAAGVDIDYVTLLKSATAGRDLVRAYAYTGLDPDNENQRNFHEFLRRSNYKVVSKDIRKYGDGKVKANLDIELVVDMMKTARNLDIAIVVSGDGDFAPAIRAVQEMGVRCEVISFRGNTSSDLIEVADQFTDIVQLARVEKGSRSGRRVAEDEADLSMTEVPDKLTEGTGAGRGGRGRGRGRTRDEAPVSATRGRGRSVSAGTPAVAGAVPVALPGERLARVGGLSEADLAAAEVFTLDDLAEDGGSGVAEPTDRNGAGEDGEPRRRRRRGGRGRGRGRGRGEEGLEGQEAQEGQDAAAQEEAGAPVGEAPRSRRQPIAASRDVVAEDEELLPTRRVPRATPFGSVWDSQLGTPTAPAASLSPIVDDDEDFDEPEIPEYLIAEQRRGANRGGGRGARGGRSAYQSAMERERFGRGGAPARRWRRRAAEPGPWHQPVSRRERPASSGRAGTRGTGLRAPGALVGAATPARVERAMERRPARAGGPPPGAGRPEAGTRFGGQGWPGRAGGACRGAVRAARGGRARRGGRGEATCGTQAEHAVPCRRRHPGSGRGGDRHAGSRGPRRRCRRDRAGTETTRDPHLEDRSGRRGRSRRRRGGRGTGRCAVEGQATGDPQAGGVCDADDRWRLGRCRRRNGRAGSPGTGGAQAQGAPQDDDHRTGLNVAAADAVA